MTWFLLLVLLAAIFSGATASVVGFGIGSLMTPLLATRLGAGVAVAAVTIPHALATALRCWRLRQRIDWRVVRGFGLLSAIGGLLGALLYTRLGPSALTKVLGSLLLLTAVAQLSGWSRRWHPRGILVGVFGLTSGLFGGVAGNQGGMRAAALMAFDLSPAAFVATATATGLMVDAARMPVYLWSTGGALVPHWLPTGIATIGVLVGTLVGERIVLGMPVAKFAQVVAWAIGVLGIWLLFGVA
ncbi:MAG: sulfite exporter TauE/SafE family protein [Gemmatimonadota bacterium]